MPLEIRRSKALRVRIRTGSTPATDATADEGAAAGVEEKRRRRLNRRPDQAVDL